MSKTHLLILLTVGVGLALRPCYGYASYRERIPNGMRVPHPCKPNYIWRGVGHESLHGGGPRNPFGRAFAANEHRWTQALCQADSDGDGKTNGQELGDPNCEWREGMISQNQRNVSHPGICDPYDSPMCLESNWDFCDQTDEFVCDAINQPDVMNITLQFTRTKVPTLETTYYCMVYDLDDYLEDDVDYHLIAMKPEIDNEDVMHHALLSLCEKDAENEVTAFNTPSTCDMAIHPKCFNLLGIWTLGLNGQCHPNNVGFLINKGSFSKFAIQFHWNNPLLVDNYWDSSALTIFLTTTLRPNNAGVLIVGNENFEIPPRQEEVIVKGTCPSWRTAEDRDDNIYFVEMLNHMHYLDWIIANAKMATYVTRQRLLDGNTQTDPLRECALRLYTRVRTEFLYYANWGDLYLFENFWAFNDYICCIRNGTSAYTEHERNNSLIARIGEEPDFNYDNPKLHRFTPNIEFRPGDELTMYCHFASMDTDKYTYFGEGTLQEMCFGFITYYPVEGVGSESCTGFRSMASGWHRESVITDGCEFRLYRNISNGLLLDLMAPVIQECRVTYCRPGCRQVVQEVMQYPCMRGDIVYIMKFILTRESVGPYTNMVAKLRSCEVEEACSNPAQMFPAPSSQSNLTCDLERFLNLSNGEAIGALSPLNTVRYACNPSECQQNCIEVIDKIREHPCLHGEMGEMVDYQIALMSRGDYKGAYTTLHTCDAEILCEAEDMTTPEPTANPTAAPTATPTVAPPVIKATESDASSLITICYLSILVPMFIMSIISAMKRLL